MPEEFLQLSELSTFTGVILAVNLLLSFTKELFDTTPGILWITNEPLARDCIRETARRCSSEKRNSCGRPCEMVVDSPGGHESEFYLWT